jgi:type II secretory ATPase GspE/PulE/Tfp pilus assembly ATPase PilB-like protein
MNFSAAHDSLEAELSYSLQAHVGRLLGITEENAHFGYFLDYLEQVAKVGVPDIWRLETFFERYCQRLDLDVNSVVAKLLRDQPTAAIDLSLFAIPPRPVRLPALSLLLFPVFQRVGELTLASAVPGLGDLLRQNMFLRLNAFWKVEKINCVWCEPAQLRELAESWGSRLTPQKMPNENIETVQNGQLPWIDLEALVPSDKLAQWFSPVLQRRFEAVPVYSGKRVLTLAVARVLDAQTKAEIEGALRHRFVIHQVLADELAIQRTISASESRAINTTGLIAAMGGNTRLERKHEALEVIYADQLHRVGVRDRSDEQAVIKFVHSILYKAVDMGASDIMFQEFPHRLRVRYKFDGDWFDENGEFPGHIAKQVISRIKVISGLEIQYVRLPQDGTFAIKIGDRRYDFRVNTSHQSQGEQAVLRLQRDERNIKTLAELGMPERYIRAIDDLMQSDHGLLILCGPTGSGKTTTIYSILRSIDPVKNNVLTAESPIEILIENISQTQIDDTGPYTYAVWARGILRQAPDIVMMGEIRDEESVEALMRLSSSGHRAISTLHTNSVYEVPSRFSLFGAQPFMVADSLKVAISQRLVKKICPRCSVDHPLPDEKRLLRLGIDPGRFSPKDSLQRGRGCDFCRGTGVSGRKAIFEVMVVDDEIRVAIQEKAPTGHIRKILYKKGEPSLFERALDEAAAGLISLEEACKFREIST